MMAIPVTSSEPWLRLTSAPIRSNVGPPMSSPIPTSGQILDEWVLIDPETDLSRWLIGMQRYDTASLDDGPELSRAV